MVIWSPKWERTFWIWFLRIGSFVCAVIAFWSGYHFSAFVSALWIMSILVRD